MVIIIVVIFKMVVVMMGDSWKTKDEIERYCGMRSEGIYIKIRGYLRQSVELDIVQLAWRHPQGR